MCNYLFKMTPIFLSVFSFMLAIFKTCSAVELTAVACEGQKLKLHCQPEEKLMILSATYGRTSKDICPHDESYDLSCNSITSKRVVVKSCQHENYCILHAVNDQFGDPCPGTVKYLTIKYKCYKGLPKTCESEFTCQDGTCLTKQNICNGIVDCSHGDDELGCPHQTEYACEGQTLQLNCKKGELITIINAYYGRSSNKICVNALMKDLKCRSLNSEKLIKERCDKKNSCQIQAANHVFGDPCFGTIKYIEVNYLCGKISLCKNDEFQCDDGFCISGSKKCDGKTHCETGEDEVGCQYLTDFACENSELHLKCEEHETLAILGASYGRHKKQICIHQDRTKCHAGVSFDIVKEKCHGKNECKIDAKNSIFGDPCPLVWKYLSVNYVCVPNENKRNKVNISWDRSGFINYSDRNITIN